MLGDIMSISGFFTTLVFPLHNLGLILLLDGGYVKRELVLSDRSNIASNVAHAQAPSFSWELGPFQSIFIGHRAQTNMNQEPTFFLSSEDLHRATH